MFFQFQKLIKIKNVKKLLFIIFMFPTIFFAQEILWDNAIDLSVSGSDATNVHIVTSSSGQYVHTVWERSNIIQSRSSSDSGQTYGVVKDVSPGGKFTTEPQITTDSSGQHVYIIWRNLSDNTIQVASSSDFGATFPIASIKTLESGIFINPLIVTDSTGQFVHTTWQDLSGNVSSISSSDFGKTFSFAQNVSFTGGDSIEEVKIDTNSTGQYVYIGWSNVSLNKMQINVSSDFGVTWSAPTVRTIPGSLKSSAGFDLRIDNTGQHGYIVWDDSGLNINISRSSDFGNSWTTTKIISVLSVTRPSLDISADGKYVHVVWVNSGTTEIYVRSSLDFGANFSSIKTLSIILPVNDQPRIAVNDIGNIVQILWYGSSGGIGFIFSRTSFDFGNTFSPAQTITSISGGFSEIATNRSGSLSFSIWPTDQGIAQTSAGTLIPDNNIKEIIRP
ncbi:MAG: hypothetical protein K940chlam5_00007 [Candidatus Anoxychlamydiales bacterium]|nr:hypothetical protein [Candidatus Anoxychlamydiales bacterium]